MSLKEERKKRNEDLIARMKKGESLAKINLQESWFPARPTIKKDKNAFDFLSGNTKKTKKTKLESVRDE